MQTLDWAPTRWPRLGRNTAKDRQCGCTSLLLTTRRLDSLVVAEDLYLFNDSHADHREACRISGMPATPIETQNNPIRTQNKDNKALWRRLSATPTAKLTPSGVHGVARRVPVMPPARPPTPVARGITGAPEPCIPSLQLSEPRPGLKETCCCICRTL